MDTESKKWYEVELKKLHTIIDWNKRKLYVNKEKDILTVLIYSKSTLHPIGYLSSYNKIKGFKVIYRCNGEDFMEIRGFYEREL